MCCKQAKWYSLQFSCSQKLYFCSEILVDAIRLSQLIYNLQTCSSVRLLPVCKRGKRRCSSSRFSCSRAKAWLTNRKALRASCVNSKQISSSSCLVLKSRWLLWKRSCQPRQFSCKRRKLSTRFVAVTTCARSTYFVFSIGIIYKLFVWVRVHRNT